MAGDGDAGGGTGAGGGGFPLNAHGNVDVRGAIPRGFVWVDEPRVSVTAKARGVAYAPAFTGFEKRRGQYRPVLQGIVVRAADEARLREALAAKRVTSPEDRRKRKEARQRRDVEIFKARILAAFPACPPTTAGLIAEQATEIGSGRVGRATEVGDGDAVRAAVVAWVRHNRTEYDDIIGEVGRDEARRVVAQQIREVLDEWATKPPQPGQGTQGRAP